MHLAYLEAQARPDEIRIEQARVTAAKARVELAKVPLDAAACAAPYAAEVLKVNSKRGELAGPASAEPAVILAQHQPLLRYFVEELDAPRVEVGMAAKVTIDGLRDCALRGRVVRLSPRMERKTLWSDRPNEGDHTKTREVRIELEGAKPLVIGLRAEVTLSTRKPPHHAPGKARTTVERNLFHSSGLKSALRRICGAGVPPAAFRGGRDARALTLLLCRAGRPHPMSRGRSRSSRLFRRIGPADRSDRQQQNEADEVDDPKNPEPPGLVDRGRPPRRRRPCRPTGPPRPRRHRSRSAAESRP